MLQVKKPKTKIQNFNRHLTASRVFYKNPLPEKKSQKKYKRGLEDTPELKD